MSWRAGMRAGNVHPLVTKQKDTSSSWLIVDWVRGEGGGWLQHSSVVALGSP